jgi:aryl-alcohol dehydrogenase-like predicted oxidoreductase
MMSVNNKLIFGGLKPSPLCFGCSSYWCRPYFEEKKALRLLSLANENKINYFHTAPHYYLGEQRLGKYIKESNPKELIVSTGAARYLDNNNKLFGSYEPKVIEKGVETSLRNLNIDAIDIVFLYGMDLGNEELIKKLIEIKMKGKVKLFGIFAYPKELDVILPKTLELNIFDAYFLQHSLTHDSQKTIDTLIKAKKLVISCTAISAVKNYFELSNLPAFWYLLRQIRRSTRLTTKSQQKQSYKELLQMFTYFVKKFNPKSGITNPVQESLSFCLQNEKIHSTMINTCNEKHLMENLKLMD